jgi:hypothetical protein
MSTPTQSRAGAACGAIFAVALFLAVGDGSGYHPARAVVATVALAFFVPFLAYLWSLLREVEGASGAPEIAMHRAHVADGTQLHAAIDGLAGGATVLSLYPLALLCAIVATLTVRSGALPRWLGIGAAITGAALFVNGAFLTTGAVPALLLFVLWTLVASVVLHRRAAPTRSGGPKPATYRAQAPSRS